MRNNHSLPTGSAAFLMLVLLLAPGSGLAQSSSDIHEGRGSFLIQQIPLGIWYGVGTGLFLTNDNTPAKTTTAITLLSASAFYFVPMAIIWNKPMSNAQAHLSVALGYRGIPAGFALGDLLNVGRERVYDPYSHVYYDRYNFRPRFGLMVATSLASQVGGYFLSRDLSLGRATLVTAYADFGWTDGLLVWTAARSATDDSDLKSSPFFLAGLSAGTAVGWLRQQRLDPTEGQVTFGRVAGTLGAVIPPALIWSLTGWGDEGKEPAWLASLAIVGNFAGVFLGEQTIRAVPLSTGDGYIIVGCAAGGALAGAGLGWLLADDDAPDMSRPIIGVGTLGAAIGMGIGGWLTHVWPKRVAYNPKPERDRWARVHLNVAAGIEAASGYLMNREFSAPNLVIIEF